MKKFGLLIIFVFIYITNIVIAQTPQSLPYSQNWTNTGLLSITDIWSSVPGIIGYRGDDLTTATGTDPQTILEDGTTTPIDVNVNQTNPNTFVTGGVAEFELANPTIALTGSGTGDAPFILISIITTNQLDISVNYLLRDLDGSVDNSIQPVALHYRVGSSDNFTNIPEAFVTDATSGPSLATLETGVNVTLPADANNQALVQIRIMTTNAVGNDEWVGIDDISISGSELPVELSSFSATTIGSTVKLSWNTATEVNNYGFEIQKLVVGSQKSEWNAIGFVNGNGNSNSPKSYSYEDKNVTAGRYSYRLKQIDNDGQFEYSKTIEVDFNAAKKFELSQNYPNPFNPATTIRFNLPEAGNVKITLYNLLGQEIRTLVNGYKESGVHTINFDAGELNSGMYIYKIEAGTFVQTRKMTFIK